jgi:hypothetical protein
MKDLTPRPTEHRGIVYRSKCEAMFALWLELRNSSDTIIDYEPDWAELGDYVPDFSVHSPIPIYDRSGVSLFASQVEVIEYKPSRPTLTYVNNVAKSMLEIAESRLRHLDKILQNDRNN